MLKNGCMVDSSSSPPNPSGLPRVAIVGRPNVGKSTLFNCLLRNRRSITHATPGVTRDPIEAEWEIEDRRIVLIDTGGYRRDSEGVEGMATEKSLSVLAEADIILLLVDVTEYTAEDEEIVERTRPYSDRIILVVNKTDNEMREAAVWNFYSLGIPSVVAISAEHRSNIGELEDEILRRLETQTGDIGATPPEIKLAILGKPNTGKSTLLNKLLGFDKAIVSDIPGTTRDVIEAEIEHGNRTLRILDTAGIRKRGKVSEEIEYYSVNRAISSIRVADVILLVVDANQGVTEQDKKIAGLVVNRGRGIILALNKWDLLPKVANMQNAIIDRTRYLFPILSFAPLVPLSALQGTGVSDLLDTALELWEQLQMRIPTGQLNQALRRWLELDPPPYGKTKRYRVRYLTQISQNPIGFILFVNKTRGFPQSWISYLKNRLREEFGFTRIPISVELRSS